MLPVSRKAIDVIVPILSLKIDNFFSWFTILGYLSPLLFLAIAFAKINFYEVTNTGTISTETGNLISFVLGAIIFGLLIRSAKKWYENRKTLFKAEHTLILSVIVLYTSIIFALLKFLVFQLDVSAYKLSDEIIEYTRNEKSTKIAEYVTRKDKSVLLLQLILKDVEASDSIRVLQERRWADLLGSTAHHRLRSNSFEFDIEYLIPSEHGDMATADLSYKMHCKSNEHKFDFTGIYSNQYIKEIKKSTYPKSPMIALLNKAIYVEEANKLQWIEQEKLLSDKRYLLGLNLFLYDSAMNVIGSAPNYFTPTSGLGRVVQFMEALFRYFYFGIFVAIIVDNSKGKDEN